MDLLYDYEKLICMPEIGKEIVISSKSKKKEDSKREFFKKYRNRYILISMLSYLNFGEVFKTFLINKLFFKTFLLNKEKQVKLT